MPIRTNIKLTGMREVLFAGKKMVEEDGIRIADGLKLCQEKVYEISQELVPIETGALKHSAELVTEGRGLMAMSTIEYGGEGAPYAWIVHEDLLAYHAPPTQAKYLSHAVELARDECQQILKRQFYSKPFSVSRGGDE